MADLEVLYFDDLVQQRNQYEPLWKSILLRTSERADIRYDPALPGLAAKLQSRPHIVIVDNVIEETDADGKKEVLSNEGARFIAEHKRLHPDTIFVLHTGKDFSILQLGQRIPNPDIIVTKDYMRIEGYQAYVAEQLRSRINRLPLDIVEDGARHVDPAQRAIVKSLVEQVVYDLLPSAGDKPWTMARLTKLSGGYSGAVVFRLDLTGGAAGSSVPTVLKLGPSLQIEREITAFQRFAKWYLPHDMRVDIVGKGSVGTQSALCYAFALGSQDKVEPLSEALRRGKKSVDPVVKQLFQSQRQGWYIAIESDARSSILDYFSNLEEYPFVKDEWRDTCFEKSLTAICERDGIKLDKRDSRLRFGGHEVDEIRRAFGRLPEVKVPMCICHGDLNANNIFHSAKRAGIALIDFEQTGIHHVFRDFISFESSVRSLFQPVKAPVLPLGDLVDLERALLQDVDTNVSASPVLEELQKIRRAAFERFPHADRAIYTASLALHLWKLLGFRDNNKSQWHASGERHLTSGLAAALGSLG